MTLYYLQLLKASKNELPNAVKMSEPRPLKLAFMWVLLANVLPFQAQSNGRNITTVTASYLWPPEAANQQRHVVQVSIVLPAKPTRIKAELEPAQKKSAPGILVGFQEAEKRGLTSDLIFNLTFRDSKCDQIYGPKSFTDSIVDGVHVFFGPSCDYTLGSYCVIYSSQLIHHQMSSLAFMQ